MYREEVRDFEQWRAAARPLLAAGVAPAAVTWSDWRTPSLAETAAPTARDDGAASAEAQHDAAPTGTAKSGGPLPAHAGPARDPAAMPASRAHAGAGAVRADIAAPAVPRRLMRLLEDLACYREASRWELMYRLTWRVLHESHALLDNGADVDVQTARLWEKAVHRDIHKMHAFVRFHETEPGDSGKSYVAWFEPSHEILRCAAPFFEKRFPNMRWMIATPDGAAVWSGETLQFIDSPARSALPREDSTHSLWRTYYRNICNVARINPTVMQRDMPRRYWQHLPEASEINSLLREGKVANQRALQTPAKPDDLRIPQAIARSLERIAPPADSLLTCRQCELWRHATQAVPGTGPGDAAIMLVGEQPGDEEDLRGLPFVGPAGRVLDAALEAAQMNRAELYVTNAVKHFKWEPRGKRRLHKRPDQQEIRACGTWLEREIEQIAPKVIVALGATAIRAVTGLAPKVEEARQQVLRHPRGAAVICTYHPSAVLRSEGERRAGLVSALESDLRHAASLVS
jgi:uracil-DNA glycosylase